MEYEYKVEALKVLERLPVAAIISKISNGEVIWMNQKALMFFGFSDVPKQITSIQLLNLDNEELEWYAAVKIRPHVPCFQPIKMGGNYDYTIVLDCTSVEINDEEYRLDTFNTEDYDSLQVHEQYCYCFEDSMYRLECIYKGFGRLNENIKDVLELVMYVYAGDRAFIYEIDRDLCCTVDLYECCRKGFNGKNEKYKTLDTETINILMSRIENGISYTAVTEDEPKTFFRERMKRGEVVRTMACPFTCRSGIKCFICIDNPRRFCGKDSFLKFSSYLLSNDIHADKIQGYLDASYLLNKSLADTAPDQVKIYMFGGFEIQTSTGILQEGSFRAPQVCALLSFLLLNRKRVLSIYEICEAIWPDQIIDNPYNQIKNVVFRARKALEGACEKTIIEANEGTYTINPDLRIWIDIEEFERLYKKASNKEIPEEQRLTLYKQAFQLYRGGMLPFLEPELWLLTRVNYYQILYTKLINEYVELLVEIGKDAEAFSVASAAIGIEPTNFMVYNILIKSMVDNGHYDLAKKFYQKISHHISKGQIEQFQQFWKTLTEKQ